MKSMLPPLPCVPLVKADVPDAMCHTCCRAPFKHWVEQRATRVEIIRVEHDVPPQSMCITECRLQVREDGWNEPTATGQ